MRDKTDLDSDLNLNFEEENLDIKDNLASPKFAQFAGYQTQQPSGDMLVKQNSEQIEAGLPTILENSGTADLQDPQKDHFVVRSKTHYKK